MSEKQERMVTASFWLSLAAGLVLFYEYRSALYFEAEQHIRMLGVVVLVVGPAIHYVFSGKLAPFLKDKTSKNLDLETDGKLARLMAAIFWGSLVFGSSLLYESSSSLEWTAQYKIIGLSLIHI